MNLEIDFSDVIRGFRRFLEDFEKSVPPSLDSASQVIIDEAEFNLEKGGNPRPTGAKFSSTPTGSLASSLDQKTSGSLEAGYETLIGSWDYYALPVEVGAHPEKEVTTPQFPSSGDRVTVYAGDIREWLLNHGVQASENMMDSMVQRMVNHLVNEGADAHPFIRPAFEDKSDDFFNIFTRKISDKLF